MAKRQDKRALRVRDIFDNVNTGNRQQWEFINQKGFDFANDNQLTENERQVLADQGMPTFTINRVTPIVEIMKYFVTANNPRWQAVGSEGSDVDIAAIHADVASYCWYISNGKSLFSQVVQDSFTKGIGYMMIDVDADKDRGMGEVVFKRIEPFDVYSHIHCDATGSYVKLDTRSLYKNRFYDLKLKVTLGEEIYFTKPFRFKAV